MKLRCLLLLICLVLNVGPVHAETDTTGIVFSFSGGSGRITITCPEVRMQDDGTWARLVFDSPHYTYVRTDGVQYSTVCTDETSEVMIPVTLGQRMDIQAMTTAMSQPHEITYSILIRMDTGDDRGLNLPYVSSMNMRYAEGFSVDYYEDGYALISVDGDTYLVVPEGKPVPESMDTGITVIQQPIRRMYLAATSAMSLLDTLDTLDCVTFSSLTQDRWTIQHAVEAMASGAIQFAGKYDAPDYELLVREGCDLAVESTMISHAPKIQEILELLGIPVFVDRSSYESHPLGRTEWIRLYGLLMGKQDQADAFFEQQAARVEAIKSFENTEKTVAFFYINTNGSAVVRSPSDSIPFMIDWAGGRYAFSDLNETDISGSSMTLEMEHFYEIASEADYLIYNASIDAPIRSVQDLIDKNELFATYKAVLDDHVYCADERLYQSTATCTDFILDVHAMLQDDDGASMHFLTKVRGETGR